jgi:hypothetical protein
LGVAIEQFAADLCFQCLHVPADRSRRHRQFICGKRKVDVASRRLKRPHRIERG